MVYPHKMHHIKQIYTRATVSKFLSNANTFSVYGSITSNHAHALQPHYNLLRYSVD